MLGLAKRVRATILQASTSEVYGDPQVHPQREDYWGHVNPLGPRACYDEGKRCAETLFFDYHRQHRLKIKVARIFNTYGPRMHPSDGRVVSNFIVQALKVGTSRSTYDGSRRVRSATPSRAGGRPDPADGNGDEVTGPAIWATRSSSAASASSRRRYPPPGHARESCRRSCRPTIPCSAARHHQGPCWPTKSPWTRN